MVEWKFILTIDSTDTEIEEPIGFNDISFNVVRDDKWHGVFFEASASQLGFYGEAFTLLKTQKEQYGVDAVVIFTASSKCEGETEYTEVISGKLNFSSYRQSCGKECIVRMPVEQNNCAMVFKNRFDQKVNVDSAIAFDKVTNLAQYSGLGFDMELATQIIPISANAHVLAGGDFISLNEPFFEDDVLLIRPVYGVVEDNSINTGNLNDPANTFQDVAKTFVLTPQVLIEENNNCIEEEYNYNIRLKGDISITWPSISADFEIYLIVDKWDGQGEHTVNATTLDGTLITPDAVSGQVYSFDQTYSGSTPLSNGTGIYAYVRITQLGGTILEIPAAVGVLFDTETSFLLENTKSCPATDSEVYLVNETLSRVTESITNRCLTVQSDYYGRIDSEPYASTEDGCGSLRVLTPGLKIRQATDKNFFASMKELMEGLRAIDNIGMGIVGDRLRIETARYFYQNVKIMDILLVPESGSDIDDSIIYSNIKSGYSKWEIKSIKGIDEFNSAKEHRTGIKSINNELDIRSGLIASGYIIENLRTQSLADTGNTDITYDNDIFIICVQRNGYTYQVEQGVTENAANFFSPSTAYNWRIRPVYNLMRWFKSIAQCYTNLVSTTNKIFFASGTGNYTAEGELSPYDACRLENKVIAEDDDISSGDFKSTDDSTPILLPEIMNLEYPLSVAKYKLIKSNPYGYINVQCGNGPLEKTYIKTVSYRPSDGMAKFTLKKSWQ